MKEIDPTHTCRSCGREVRAERWRRGHRDCADCAMARCVINAVEIAAEYGEGHRKRLAGMVRYVSRETSRLPTAAEEAKAAERNDMRF